MAEPRVLHQVDGRGIATVTLNRPERYNAYDGRLIDELSAAVAGLAEDAAVAQTLSNGRLELGIGAGYRAQEFETFGRKLENRWQAMGETIAFLRQAWTGEQFEWQGRRCLITPQPAPFAPPILLGGSSPAAARRAARIADGWFPPLDPRLWTPYREECIVLGKADPGPYPKQGPIFLWVAEEPDQAWELVMPHVLHQLDSYSRWTTEAMGKPAGPYAGGMTADKVRESPAYRVLTPAQVLQLVADLGDHSVVYLNPLLSGIDPAQSWSMLRLYEEQVHPAIREVAGASGGERLSADLED